jgi:hypothetical protein
MIGLCDQSLVKLVRTIYVRWYSNSFENLKLVVGQLVCFRDLKFELQAGYRHLYGDRSTSCAFVFQNSTTIKYLNHQPVESTASTIEIKLCDELETWSKHQLLSTSLLEQSIYQQISINTIGHSVASKNRLIEYEELEPRVNSKIPEVLTSYTDLICLVAETPRLDNGITRLVVWDGTSNGKCVLPANGLYGTQQDISAALKICEISVGRNNTVLSTRKYRDFETGSEIHLGCVLIVECTNPLQSAAIGALTLGTWIQIRNINFKNSIGWQSLEYGMFRFISAYVSETTMINVLQPHFA